MRFLRVLTAVLVGLVTALTVGALHARSAIDAVYPRPLPGPVDSPVAGITHGRPTIAILLGPAGANAADVLAPYETLAASGRYTVVTVAEHRHPVTLTGGLQVLPDRTFADLGHADWIVVPEVQQADGAALTPTVDWLRRQYAAGSKILSVCAGAALLARTGLLGNGPATSHWLGLYVLERSHPEVRWVRGTRYVDNGRIITTAAVLSGIDGALRILEREQGVAVAERAAAAVRWPGYHPGSPAAIDSARPGPADAVALLGLGYRSASTTGVLLTPGVGEVELASVFRTYTQFAYAARLTPLTADGAPVRSRHGLTFLPRAGLGDATGLDRLLVPGHDAAVRHDAAPAAARPVYVHRRDTFAFDGTLRDLASTTDVPTARWVAKTMEYRTDGLDGPAFPWLPALAAVLAALLGATTFVAARAALTRRPRLRYWLRHLIGMTVAMVVGMLLLGPLWPAAHGDPAASAVPMALDMAAGMALWMAFRGHGARMIGEMTVVMVAPFAVLLILHGAGWFPAGRVSGVGHALMFAAMIALMIARWRHYATAPSWAFARARAARRGAPGRPGAVTP